MKLEEFLHNLHFDIDKANSPDWEVDWDDAPLAYKLYQGLPTVPLSLEVPLTLEGYEAPAKPDLRRMSHFLWYVNGLAHYCETVLSPESPDPATQVMHTYKRFPPSGGALYPNELYVYLKLDDLPHGVYHYDAAHHRLALLREGNFDTYINKAIGHSCDLSACFGTVFVSTMFWKNFYKYNNFAYRLQGLDAGAMMGQLLETAKRFGFETGVYFQFLDRSINHLLGLPEQEESVYGVIPLTVEPTIWMNNSRDIEGTVFASELCQELPAIKNTHYVRSKSVKEYPLLTTINEASLTESTQTLQPIERKKRDNPRGQRVPLPEIQKGSYDFASVCQQRFSPDMDFVLGKITAEQLAFLLKEATRSFYYRNDLDGVQENPENRVTLYGCFYNVEGIPNGAYHYDGAAHELIEVQPGDHRLQLQSGMSLHNVNLLQVPLCLHVAGDKDFDKTSLGYRGYRIQQMEAGMLVQRLLLAASAIGMGGHPLLGYDANLCDEIYKMKHTGKTSLIQVPIGSYRQRPWLKGSLRS
ncbi:SagB family peptide dehydrogenase [Mesobacillus foraminis]|uniref:SagB family peptide dehydrogenase n=1 Tax=Mesobacillus foraminis TaxID=279826 RepID=UPI000EF4BBAD|nr:SagB family peptide dehydrogenase [Mesobacillus foraminis]